MTTEPQREFSPLLIVDDDKKITDALSQSFKYRGIASETAASGRETLDRLQERGRGYYRAIILDIAMETPTAGLDILPEIQAIDAGLQVIYLSAVASEERAVEQIIKGAAHMLAKPASPDTLFYTVLSAITFARVKNEARTLEIQKRELEIQKRELEIEARKQEAIAQERELENKNKQLVIGKLFNHNLKNLAMAGQAYLGSLDDETANLLAINKAKFCFDAIQVQALRIMAMNAEPDQSDAAGLAPVLAEVRKELENDPDIRSVVLDSLALSIDALPKLQVWMKPDTLRAILSELVHNAVVHNPETPRITIDAEQQDATVEIKVRNDGEEIPADRQDKLFEVQPGQSVHGLGLPYCYEVLRTHHGKIQVTSQPGKTEFILTIPAANSTYEGR
ncbi:MAG: histidine kinase,Response regulator receiver domain proteinhistidine kinase [Planctomycetaceae bacterium]|nr:histidine kinase,Response regulator receiver domain proteinhistidine kinase [Planctomycetaceae bacterium]